MPVKVRLTLFSYKVPDLYTDNSEHIYADCYRKLLLYNKNVLRGAGSKSIVKPTHKLMSTHVLFL